MLIGIFQNKKVAKGFVVIAILYLAFAGFLIYQSSTVAIDGNHYFSLFDDAMISMRYAGNLANGNGLVWNVGERIEGFTNPLLVFIMALAIFIFGKVGAVLAIQIFGLLLIAINVGLILKITHQLLPRNRFHDSALFFAGFFSLTFYPLLYWSITGMETGLLATLVLYACWLLVSEDEFVFLNWPLAMVLGLCYLTRPDSVLFIAIVFLFRVIKKTRSVSMFLRIVGEATLVLVIISGYQLFRNGYYGAALPNTYILKATGMDFWIRLQNGWLFIIPFLRQFSALIITAIISLIVMVSHRHSSLQKKLDELFIGARSFILLFLALFTTYLTYQVIIGGDAWPPYWRFVTPYLILFFIALVVISAVVAQLVGSTPKKLTYLLTLLLFLELLYGGKAYVYDLLIDRRPYQSQANDTNINTALALRELTTEEATVAPYWAGTIGYYSQRYSIDPLGKMDPYIANLPADVSGAVGWGGMISVPGHNKYDLEYSFKLLRPDFIQYIGSVCTWGQQNLKRWCDENYKLVEYKGVQLLLKKDSQNIYWDKIK